MSGCKGRLPVEGECDAVVAAFLAHKERVDEDARERSDRWEGWF